MATIKFGIPDVPYSQVELADSEGLESALSWAAQFREMFIAAFPHQVTEKLDERSERPRFRTPQPSAPAGGQRETRADKYPVVPGMQCDQCGGPVGRYPKTGRMTSDKGVCLGRCKDGQYVYTVGWLNDEPDDSEPF